MRGLNNYDLSGAIARPNAGGIFIDDYAHDNVIGGTTEDGNLISGNSSFGVCIHQYAYNNEIKGNKIGTDASGNVALANAGGVWIRAYSHDNVVGRILEAERNIVSGNTGIGVYIMDASSNEVIGNYIGIGADGATALANGDVGVYIQNCDFNQIGPGNVIAYTGGGATPQWYDDIRVTGSDADYNLITQNSMYQNEGKGVLLDSGANNSIPFPAITSVVKGDLTITISGLALNGYKIEVFKAEGPVVYPVPPYPVLPEFQGEGKVYLGTTTADGSGNWPFVYDPDSGPVALEIGEKVTATATDTNNNTSEFAINVEVSLLDTELPSKLLIVPETSPLPTLQCQCRTIESSVLSVFIDFQILNFIL